MFGYQLFQVFVFLLICAGVHCFFDRCEGEVRTEMAKIKSVIENLQDVALALTQKLDTDFKWPPEFPENCPAGFKYLPLAGSCYKVIYENHNWASADQRCEELHAGAHLAAITTADENKAIKSFLRSQHLKNTAVNVCLHPNWASAGKIVWTSGQRQNPSSCAEPFVWKALNDTQLPFSYTDWDSLEPNCQDDKEHCLSLVSGAKYRWNDLSCDVAICPLCEYNPV